MDESKETESSALYTLYGVQSIDEIACDDLSKWLTLLGNSWLPSSINAGWKTRKSSTGKRYSRTSEFRVRRKRRSRVSESYAARYPGFPLWQRASHSRSFKRTFYHRSQSSLATRWAHSKTTGGFTCDRLSASGSNHIEISCERCAFFFYSGGIAPADSLVHRRTSEGTSRV